MNKKIVLVSALVIVLAITATVAVAQSGIPGSGWWSGEQVQNVGTSTANIVVTAYDKNGAATYSSSVTVTAGSAFTFVPSSFAGMPSGFIGSAVVSSDQPIKAIVNLTNQLAGSYGVAGGKGQAQYQGIESAGTTLYFPLAKHNYYGNTTSFYIQNAGTTAATATAVFKTAAGGTYSVTTPSIDPNKMVVVSPIDAGVPAGNTNASLGSLTVTSAQPLAGTVLEYIQAQTVATQLNGTRGFTAADFDVKAFAPVAKNKWYGRFTGIQVQNVSSGPVDITVTFVGSGGACAGTTYTDSATGVAAGTSKTFVQLTAAPNNSHLPENCVASATVSATGNVVTIVNEQNLSGFAQAGITYSAMANSAKTTKVSVPLFKDTFYGSSTGLQIQNVGTANATNVVATFVCAKQAGGTFTAISTPQTIVPGGAKLFYKPSTMPAGTFTGANPFSSNLVNCAVTVTADQPIVAIANENTNTAGALDDNNYEGFNLTP
jgi:hypothetical protein